jgi:hypothetical protein
VRANAYLDLAGNPIGGTATDLNCIGCVASSEVDFNYAGSSSKGGAATSALLADTATNALALGGFGVSAFEKVANKNAASGYAGLDSSSRIAKAQAPAATAYKDAGNTFTAGTQDLSGAGATLPVKSVLSANTPSSCVANKELLIKTDATAGQQLFICNGSGTGWNLAGDGTSAGGGVTSFEGRTGAVVSASGDYGFAEISGTVGSTQLSGTYTEAVTLSNASNSFTGSGAGLTSLSASNLSSGTLPDARLSGTYSNALTLSSASNSFTGSGAGLTALNASNLASGTLPDARLSGTYSNALTLSSASNSFTGSGAGLTALNASNLGSGTVPSGRISGTYSSAVTFSSASNSFTGDGAGLTNVNAATAATATNALNLGGVAAANFARRDTANTFTGDQSITGNLSLSGSINGGFVVQSNATSPNIIGGYSGNSVTAGIVGAVIGGGGTGDHTNRVTDNYGTVGGGYLNQAGDDTSSDMQNATVGGGRSNLANNIFATVGGGSFNTASGAFSTVGGGYSNTAQGDYSYAGGRRAKANHDGAFVWGDSTDDDAVSAGPNEFRVRATGGAFFSNDLTAGHFFGDGSGLTNLPGGGGTATDLDCTGCVSSGEVDFNYAGSSSKGGAATSALLADTATNALALGGFGVSAFEKVANKNAASGYAGLDGSSRIAKAQAPAATAYKDAGNTFTTGTQDLSGAGATLPVKSVLSANTPSSCVANKELLIKTDATAGQQLFICNGSGTGWNLAGDGTSAGGGVTSFEGRTGAVVSANGDYTFSEISGTVGATQLSGTYSNALTLSSASNSFTGDGAGLTNVTAANASNADMLDGLHASSFATLAANTFTANQNIAGTLTAASSASGATAVYGQATNVSSTNTGVHGRADGTDGSGVFGEAHNGTSAVGVWGYSTSGLAGDFSGNVNISGSLAKAGGSFKIDHPLDPANKYLSHSFVESPDMKNVYDGVVTLDARGEAVVELPEWFEALNRDFRYQLTAIGGPAPSLHIANKIAQNRFKIAGGSPGLEVSWQVTGTRRDAWANAHRIPVESAKSVAERGYYLHPDLYGAAQEKGMGWAHHPEQMGRMKEGRVEPRP